MAQLLALITIGINFSVLLCKTSHEPEYKFDPSQSRKVGDAAQEVSTNKESLVEIKKMVDGLFPFQDGKSRDVKQNDVSKIKNVIESLIAEHVETSDDAQSLESFHGGTPDDSQRKKGLQPQKLILPFQGKRPGDTQSKKSLQSQKLDFPFQGKRLGNSKQKSFKTLRSLFASLKHLYGKRIRDKKERFLQSRNINVPFPGGIPGDATQKRLLKNRSIFKRLQGETSDDVKSNRVVQPRQIIVNNFPSEGRRPGDTFPFEGKRSGDTFPFEAKRPGDAFPFEGRRPGDTNQKPLSKIKEIISDLISL